MDIKVYNTSNVYHSCISHYGKPPLDVNFKFTEVNQYKSDNKIFVHMKYDANWIWPIDNVESGSRDIDVVFQVIEIDDKPYIEKN